VHFFNKMSFSVFRASLRNATAAPLRRTAAQAPNCNKILLRNTFSRKYSTPPPPPQPTGKWTLGLYIRVFAAVAGLGITFYYLEIKDKEPYAFLKSGVQAPKVKVNFVPSKQDYIKVNQTLFLLLVLFLTSYVFGVGIQQNCPHH
jgi:cytochrome c peroxidase